MKTYKKIFLFATAITALLFVSCKEEPIGTVPPYVTVNTLTISAPAIASRHNVTLASNMGWEIKVLHNSDWITITQPTGENSAVVPVNISANPTTEARRDTLVFVSETGANIVRRIPVVQAAASLIMGSTFSHLYGAVDSVRVDTIAITTPVSWTAEVVDAATNSWLTLTTASGVGGAQRITMELAENDSYVRRHAFIAVAATEIDGADTILVVQKGGKNYLVDNPSTALIIGSVRWATRNLDAFGTFADAATDLGGLFDMVNKNPTPTNAAWNILNNPCPCDWRLPTVAEVRTLLTPDVNHRVHYWESAPAGAWFGPNARNATFATPGSALFLPAALSGNTAGMYWTSTITINDADEEVAQTLVFGQENVNVGARQVTNVFSVRCVTDRRIATGGR